jgi:hypothetical protein
MNQTKTSETNPLDEAWELIGNMDAQENWSIDFSAGYYRASADALLIIEKLGGRDPLTRKSEGGG